MEKFNLHTHTYRCHHAKGEDEEYVIAAIENGYKTMGFSDHAPYIFPKELNYYSDFRMEPYRAQDYVDSVRHLQEKYKDQIDIKLGFEVEWYPQLIDEELKFLKSFDYDYLILGQHFTRNEYEKDAIHVMDGTRKESDLDLYISQVLTAAKSGEFVYVAHPDVLNFKGNKKVYVEKMTEFVKELKKIDIPIEYNFLGFWDHRNYPNRTFWEIVSQVGNRTVMGLDAHQPWIYADTVNIDNMRNEIHSLGLNLIEDVNEILK